MDYNDRFDGKFWDWIDTKDPDPADPESDDEANNICPARTPDYGVKAHLVAENHLRAIWGHEFLLSEGDEPGEHPAFGAWCGCTTCIVREVLMAAWPVFEEYVSSGAYQRDQQVHDFAGGPLCVRCGTAYWNDGNDCS